MTAVASGGVARSIAAEARAALDAHGVRRDVRIAVTGEEHRGGIASWVAIRSRRRVRRPRRRYRRRGARAREWRPLRAKRSCRCRMRPEELDRNAVGSGAAIRTAGTGTITASRSYGCCCTPAVRRWSRSSGSRVCRGGQSGAAPWTRFWRRGTGAPRSRAAAVYFLRADTTMHRVAPLACDGRRDALCFRYARASDLERAVSHETLEQITLFGFVMSPHAK